MKSSYAIANDNDPRFAQDPVGLRAIESHRALPVARPQFNAASNAAHNQFLSALCIGLWLLGLMGMIAAFFVDMDSRHQALAMGFGLWSSLWMVFQARAKDWTAIVPAAAMTALAAAMAGLAVLTERMGLPIDISHILFVGALGATLLALITRTQSLLWLALGLSVIWAFNLPQLIGGSIDSLAWAAPALWGLIMLTAHDLKSKHLTAMGAALGYGWLCAVLWLTVTAGFINLPMAVCALFMTAALHYRAGKVMRDKHNTVAIPHVLLGWSLAAVAALALQDYIGATNHLPWADYSRVTALGGSAWDLTMAVGVLAIGCAGLWRFRSGRMSALGVTGSMIIAAIMPLTIWGYPVWTMLTEQQGYNFSTFSALTLGGMILASAAALALNGARQDNSAMIFAGLMVAGLEITLVMPHLLADYGQALLFGMAAIISAMVIAAYAARSQSPRRNSSPKKHKAANTSIPA